MEQRNKNMKKKIIGLAVAVLAVLAAVLIGIFASKDNGTGKLQELLDTGAKYLAELDYEQAVAVYREAIALEPKSVDAYLGLAEAYLGMGDVESAIVTLENGYEVTGDAVLLERLKELKGEKEVSTENTSNPEQNVEDDVWGYIEYDFHPEDITLMGYNLFEDYYKEIATALISTHTWDGDTLEGYYSLETENRKYMVHDSGGKMYYSVLSISHPEPNATYAETLWDVVYENSDPSGQKAEFRHFWTHGYGEGMDEMIVTPIRNHQSFEEVCQILQVDTIREKAMGEADNTPEHGWYYFKSNLGNCHYYENFHGSNQDGEDALIGTCIFAIYYETGYTFKIEFAVRRDGLVESCQYEYSLEEDGYPEYRWDINYWEAVK